MLDAGGAHLAEPRWLKVGHDADERKPSLLMQRPELRAVIDLSVHYHAIKPVELQQSQLNAVEAYLSGVGHSFGRRERTYTSASF
ncbi:MAG: hypothetical protein ABSG50_01585 [Opitutaceae bacterium]